MILKHYFYREILEKLIWIIGLLILILTSTRFVDYLADAAAGQLPSDFILTMLGVKMLATLPRILPVAMFLAVILALARLSQDKELIIMSSAGIESHFQLSVIFRFSLLFAVLVFAVSFFVSPWAENNVQELKDRAKQQADITGISAGRFKEFSKGDRVVYIKGLTEGGQSMEKVFLQVRQNENLGVLNSDSARYKTDEQSGARYILFENGHRYVGKPGMLDYQITEYRHYGVLMEQQNNTVSEYKKLESIPSSTLIDSDIPGYKAEFQWRLSYVIATLLLPILAVVLNRFTFGENRYVSLMIGILIYFIYSNLLSISKTLVKREEIAAFIGVWWVHLLLFIIIVIFLKLQETIHSRGKMSGSRNPIPAHK